MGKIDLKISQAEFAAIIKAVVAEIQAILEQSDSAKKIADKGLDIVEIYAKNSKNKIDDAVLLPMCKAIRGTFGIPDND